MCHPRRIVGGRRRRRQANRQSFREAAEAFGHLTWRTLRSIQKGSREHRIGTKCDLEGQNSVILTWIGPKSEENPGKELDPTVARVVGPQTFPEAAVKSLHEAIGAGVICR